MSKNKAGILKREAGTCRRLLKQKLAHLDPFCDQYQRIEAILEKVEKRYQRRLAVEKRYQRRLAIERSHS